MAKSNARVERWWKRFAGSWGAKMAEEYGPTAPHDWAGMINQTDDQRLQTALTAARHKHPNWPPSLGQFEAAIPRKAYRGDVSAIDRLAMYAEKKFPLCEHQRMVPWSYFGSRETMETHGVVVPPCKPCEKPSHRATVQDL